MCYATAVFSPNRSAILVKPWSVALRLHHVERNLDIAPRGVGICTCLAMRSVDNGLGDFAVQTRQADVKPCSEEVDIARIAQVYFGIDGCVRWKLAPSSG